MANLPLLSGKDKIIYLCFFAFGDYYTQIPHLNM